MTGWLPYLVPTAVIGAAAIFYVCRDVQRGEVTGGAGPRPSGGVDVGRLPRLDNHGDFGPATHAVERWRADLLPDDYDQACRVAREAFEHMASFGASRNTLLSIAEGWIEDIEHGARGEDADRSNDMRRCA